MKTKGRRKSTRIEDMRIGPKDSLDKVQKVGRENMENMIKTIKIDDFNRNNPMPTPRPDPKSPMELKILKEKMKNAPQKPLGFKDSKAPFLEPKSVKK